MYRDAIYGATVMVAIRAFFVGVIVGALVVAGIPAFWDWIKPWIHAITA